MDGTVLLSPCTSPSVHLRVAKRRAVLLLFQLPLNAEHDVKKPFAGALSAHTSTCSGFVASPVFPPMAKLVTMEPVANETFGM